MSADTTAWPTPIDLPALAQRHDVLLVDQFGVLHDGSAAYPGAIDALSALKAAGATVVLLSNSGKRSRPNEDRLLSFGFRKGSWDHFLSSGEVAWRMFRGGYGYPAIEPATRILLIARDDDRTAVEGLNGIAAKGGEDADMVLLSGSEGDRYDLGHYRKVLAPAAARRVPLVCSNPDKIMLTPAGPRFGAGRIAELYEELGGTVTWIGKPFAQIYDAALEDIGTPDKARIVGVGDSVEHDIAGAKGAGLKAALVGSGILADLNAEDLRALFVRHAAVPDYILSAFRGLPEDRNRP